MFFFPIYRLIKFHIEGYFTLNNLMTFGSQRSVDSINPIVIVPVPSIFTSSASFLYFQIHIKVQVLVYIKLPQMR